MEERSSTVAQPGRDEPLWSVAELATRLKVPAQTVYGWNSRGGGPRFIRVGRFVRYDPADVQAWLESRRSEVRREEVD